MAHLGPDLENRGQTRQKFKSDLHTLISLRTDLRSQSQKKKTSSIGRQTKLLTEVLGMTPCLCFEHLEGDLRSVPFTLVYLSTTQEVSLLIRVADEYTH